MLPAIGTTAAERWLQDPGTGSYEILFAICASAYLLALLVVHLLSPRLAPVKV